MLSEANLIVLFIRPLVDYFQYLLGNGQRILFSVFFSFVVVVVIVLLCQLSRKQVNNFLSIFTQIFYKRHRSTTTKNGPFRNHFSKLTIFLYVFLFSIRSNEDSHCV